VLAQLTDRVTYHVGLDFECGLDDLILIDEADDMIFADPAKFKEKTQHSRIICFTATARTTQ
jgi:hypothetical protein